MKDDNPKMEELGRMMTDISRNHDPNEPTDPEIVKLLEEGMDAIRQLDPIVRETFRDQPEKLAEWDSIMHMNDAADEIDEAKKLGTPDAPVTRLGDEFVQ